MIHKFREAVNGTTLRNIILALFVLAAGHFAAWDEAAAQESTAGEQIHSEAAHGSVHPVKVIIRQDIELSGVKRITDMLDRADFNNFGLSRPLVLGRGRTIVLVNGRRVTDSQVDTDIIPIAAVERIEIFTDSTSALHGGGASNRGNRKHRFEKGL